MKFQNSERIKFICLIIILILVNLLINRPYFSSLKKINNEFISEADLLKTAYISNQGPQQTLNKYQDIKKQLTAYENIFLKEGQELELIKELETLAANNNLIQTINLNPSPQEAYEDIYKLDLRLDLMGDFFDMLNYLEDLNELKYQLTVKMLNMDNKTNKVSMSLFAKTYWLYDETKKN
ncbi:type 4a pilus biogenesis protein PilO [Patescibacteria group bacterium]|nr:type 4a pilus biogenesis protein PilO [Patescibacteria group bacterium]